jgi:hypothetical protein
MNGKIITNHGTPLNSMDVANKAYVDSQSGGVTSSVTLTGTAYSSVSIITTGCIMIFVKGDTANSPSAIFEIVKNNPNKNGVKNRICSVPGNLTGELLEISWLPNSGLRLRKTGSNFNGLYTVKISGIF